MKKVLPTLLLSLALSACAAELQVPIYQQLSGKNKQERVATLTSACEAEFNKSHVTTNYSVKDGKIRYRPHTKETKAVCGAMAHATNGSRTASTGLLLNQCLNEKVIGGRIQKNRNQKHIERVNNICRALSAEM